MSLAWMAPAALAGIGLVVLPIAIHLLVRQPARRLLFPSLRFLRETQLAALRRRTIQDAWLLLCRCLIVAIAAIALAGPVFQSDARREAFSARTSRAIIAIGAIDDATTAALREGAFKSEVFNRAALLDAIADATRWLDAQPPSSREILVAGQLRRGDVTAADLSAMPSDIGIRFHPLNSEAPAETIVPILTRRDGRLTRIDRAVTLTSDATTVADRTQSIVPEGLVAIAASPDDTELANAALRAALDAGVPWMDFTTPVIVVWEGGSPAPRPNARVIDMAVPKPAASAADAVHAALVRGTRHPLVEEPIAITREQLDRWTRSPGPVSPAAPLSDEGDRRWMWAMVLLLLMVETWLRRPVRATEAEQSEEARVA